MNCGIFVFKSAIKERRIQMIVKKWGYFKISIKKEVLKD